MAPEQFDYYIKPENENLRERITVLEKFVASVANLAGTRKHGMDADDVGELANEARKVLAKPVGS